MIRMLLFAVLLAACATIPDAAPSFGPTVYVQNATDRALEIHAAGIRMASVPAGGTRCIALGERAQEVTLQAVTRAGEVLGESVPFAPHGSADGGWHWRIGQSAPVTRVALRPGSRCS